MTTGAYVNKASLNQDQRTRRPASYSRLNATTTKDYATKKHTTKQRISTTLITEMTADVCVAQHACWLHTRDASRVKAWHSTFNFHECTSSTACKQQPPPFLIYGAKSDSGAALILID